MIGQPQGLYPSLRFLVKHTAEGKNITFLTTVKYMIRFCWFSNDLWRYLPQRLWVWFLQNGTQSKAATLVQPEENWQTAKVVGPKSCSHSSQEAHQLTNRRVVCHLDWLSGQNNPFHETHISHLQKEDLKKKNYEARTLLLDLVAWNSAFVSE